jgi:hypothetical protein
MARKRKARWLVPLGRSAVFYVPTDKLDDPQFGRDGSTATQIFDQFFLDNFGGFTHEESKIQGKWVSPDVPPFSLGDVRASRRGFHLPDNWCTFLARQTTRTD